MRYYFTLINAFLYNYPKMPKSRLLQSLLDKFAKKDELCKLLFRKSVFHDFL